MHFKDVKNWGQHLEYVAETQGVKAAQRLAKRGGDTYPPTPYVSTREIHMLPTVSAPDGYVGIVRVMIGDAEKTGYIYFVQSGGRVKVGYSVSPKERYRHLRSMMPDESKLLGWFPGSCALEAALHRLFDPIRVHKDRKEWFHLTPALSKVIKTFASFKADKELEAAWLRRVIKPNACAEVDEMNRREG